MSKDMPNNPAGRLLTIVKKLKGVPGDILTDRAWAQVVGCDAADSAVLLQRVGAIFRLGVEVRCGIERQEVNHELWLEGVNEILKAFRKAGFTSRADHLQQTLTPEAIRGLALCDDLLRRSSSEKTISEDKLLSLRKDICDLTEEVVHADIDKRLKDYLLDKLETMRIAVDMYGVTGSKGLEEAAEGIVGSARMKSDVVQDLKQSPFWEKFRQVFGHLLVVISGVNDVAQLPESVDKVLETISHIVRGN